MDWMASVERSRKEISIGPCLKQDPSYGLADY